mmetsp:Transcript_12418/g.12198  ORF Transcript_12418/g.12198 Transcript_12418/m.12198 type:complete len:88 (-) Transcript_12418:275-538(-)
MSRAEKLGTFREEVSWDLSQVREGDPVYAVGYGFFGSTFSEPLISKGVVSRVVLHEETPLFILHTARTYPGHSGGALFTKDGLFIGL